MAVVFDGCVVDTDDTRFVTFDEGNVFFDQRVAIVDGVLDSEE